MPLHEAIRGQYHGPPLDADFSDPEQTGEAIRRWWESRDYIDLDPADRMRIVPRQRHGADAIYSIEMYDGSDVLDEAGNVFTFNLNKLIGATQ